MFAVEADSFWCLSKLLEGIQDNYTFAQPGIQRQVAKLKELIHRIDREWPMPSSERVNYYLTTTVPL